MNYCCRAKRRQPPILDDVYSFYSCQIPARLMYFSQSKSQFVCRSFGSHFLTSQNIVVYQFIYAGSLRWQSDHFRKLCSVRRRFIGAMTFNFDHMAYRIIAYFFIAWGLFYNITIWFWRKSIIFLKVCW
jgi:hypothetical protein